MHKSWQSEVFGDGIKSINTVKKYSYAWSRWKTWASEKIGVDVKYSKEELLFVSKRLGI